MKLLKNQSGQGMTEYIIIVAVIALAGIAAFSYFGKTVRSQTAAMSDSLAGTDASASITAASTAAGKADTEATTDASLSDYVDRKPGASE
ncbi:MAG: hypothetical protein KAR01_09785 [Desulfocapsa sp.]|nr:hypothetical protein [Desulfocapsa sp.]